MTNMERRLHGYEPIFGGWYMDGKIGSGTFGRVFRLRSRELLGRQFFSALKVIEILPDEKTLEDPARLEQLVRNEYLNEVALLNTLHGVSHIVGIEDQALIELREDGRLVGYDLLIRMELLESVAELLKAGDKSLYAAAEARRLGQDICYALIYCHQEGILHRDINPNNIFRNRCGEYKLGDFGISKHLSGAMRAKTNIGTKRYTAPEVLAGEPYDVRDDLYSLGLVLYQLTNAGYPPFLTEEASKGETEHAQERRLNGEPLPPPAHADDALAKIILKATAYESSDRFETAQDMYDALTGAARVALKDGFWWRSVPQGFSLLGMFGLTPNPTNPMRYMADVLTGEKKQKLIANGVLNRHAANSMPHWRIRKAWFPYNRLLVDRYAEIAAHAFEGRADLQSVHCTDTVKTVGSQAFSGCVNLVELVLENGIQRVLSGAFSGCSRLTECHLPDSVRTLGEGAFADCGRLQTVRLPEGLNMIPAKLLLRCTALRNVTIPASVRSIGAQAFRGSGIEKLELPETCSRLSDAAFLGCRQLTMVQLSSQTASIPKSCFSGCAALKEITLPPQTVELCGRAFYGCAALERIVIPEGVRRIGAEVFAQCDALTGIELPDSLEQIGKEAFGSGGFLKSRFGKLTVLANKGSVGWSYCRQNGIRVEEP